MTDKKSLNLRRDTLTNCYATEGFKTFLAQMESEFVATRAPFSILIMDVDHFKLFNDKHGHLNGDEVLKYFSSALRLDLEDESNVPFRYGGDEFVVVFPGKTANDAYALAQRLRKNMRARSCIIKGRQQKVTFSGGIACYPVDAKTCDSLFEKADKALYYSKRHGRARVTRHHEIRMKFAFQILAAMVLVFAAIASITFSQTKIQPAIDNSVAKAREAYHSVRLRFHIPTWPAQKHLETPLPAPEPVSTPPAPFTAPPASVIAQETPKPKMSKVLLATGKSIQGVIVAQTDEWVKLQLGLDQGTGSIRIKRAQIVRIEESP